MTRGRLSHTTIDRTETARRPLPAGLKSLWLFLNKHLPPYSARARHQAEAATRVGMEGLGHHTMKMVATPKAVLLSERAAFSAKPTRQRSKDEQKKLNQTLSVRPDRRLM